MSSTLASMDVVAEPLALAEFLELPYELIELVEGQPVLMNAAAGPHQLAVSRLLSC